MYLVFHLMRFPLSTFIVDKIRILFLLYLLGFGEQTLVYSLLAKMCDGIILHFIISSKTKKISRIFFARNGVYVGYAIRANVLLDYHDDGNEISRTACKVQRIIYFFFTFAEKGEEYKLVRCSHFGRGSHQKCHPLENALQPKSIRWGQFVDAKGRCTGTR